MNVLASTGSYNEALSLASQGNADVILVDDSLISQPDRLQALVAADKKGEGTMAVLVSDLELTSLRDLLSQGVRAVVRTDEPPQHLEPVDKGFHAASGVGSGRSRGPPHRGSGGCPVS
jgi:DNA-binding NarL/FixJ family response regulator